MKIILTAIFLLLFKVTNAQDLPADSTLKNIDTTNFGKPDNTNIRNTSIYDTAIDSRPHNKYGDLLNDDPAYNHKYPWYVPAVKVVISDATNWAVNKFIFHYDFANISARTWKYNLTHGWEWDNDHFGTNFIGHPYSGSLYFNIARSNGYSFWGSIPYAIEGSLVWEYFGENTKPSKNDIINTPLSGLLLGEMLYRISSNILDDRATGANRVWREILAAVISPQRAFNRLTQGKMFRHTTKEVYQKEPLNITMSAGMHKINDNNKFATGQTNFTLDLQLDYGDPFEVRHRKPFDVFRLRTESSFGISRKILGNVTGYGLLFGRNVVKGENGTLIGGFQYFDYWNNKVFELGSLGFGVGVISRIPFLKVSELYSSIHFAGVPLAANNTSFGPDTSLFRDYNFGGGLEAKIEETFNLKFVSIGFSGYYYWLQNYENLKGTSSIGILKPRVIFNLSKSIGLGFEHQVYYVNRHLKNNPTPTLHLTRTEQKLFLQVFLEDPRRRGRYH
ncbi:MAG: hypothetical protein JWN83_804 [Chitinophagaceae bacterium]|nr:hypothetical protein [Chitinophagaceae bacterium]